MFPPGPKFYHQAGQVQALGLCPESLEFRAAFLQQRAEPGGIAVRVVMAGCSHLDETVPLHAAPCMTTMHDNLTRSVVYDILPPSRRQGV
jgi:hypothetical protein